MLLTQIEKDSLLWKKLDGHLNDLLERDRRGLEKMTNDAEKTACLRGRIKVLRELISLSLASEETNTR